MLFDQKSPTLSESKVCPYFIRDLQFSLAGRLKESLLHSASLIDAFVSSVEQRCAKMMTILKPIYVIAGIEMPSVPVARVLSSYQIPELEYKVRLTDENMDAIRLTVFRARRKANLKLKEETSTEKFELEKKDSHRNEVLLIIDLILEQMRERYNDEVTKRMHRKISCTVDRVTDIETYRSQLVENLHRRKVVSREDKTNMRYYKEQFRFPDETEPIIFQTDSLYQSKKGRLIVTATHVCFYR
jgi:hypothetical protein